MPGANLVHKLRNVHRAQKHGATSTGTAVDVGSESGEHGQGITLNKPIVVERRRSVRPKSMVSYADKAMGQFKLGRHNSVKSMISTTVTAWTPRTLGDLLLSLPQELRIQILVNLSLDDILSLRRCSAAFNQLVKSCESPVVRHHVRNILTDLEVKLYPAPAPMEADLNYLLNLRHREIVVRKLAKQMCDFVAIDVLKRNNARRRKEFEPRYRHMYSKMLPLLLILGQFFESFRKSVLDRCFANSSPDKKFRLVPGTTVWDEQLAIMDQYKKQQLLDCYHMYGFILQVFERKLRPPRFNQLLNRFLPGYNRRPASTKEIETTLILGGIDAVRQILLPRTYVERRRALSTFLGGLDPAMDHRWERNWRRVLGPDADKMGVSKIPHTTIGVPPLHVIWVPCALQLLLRKRVIEQVDFRGTAAQQSAREFVRDLLGYDLFRPGVLNNSNDDEEDDDDADDDDGDDDDEDDTDADDSGEGDDEEDEAEPNDEANQDSDEHEG